jgi:hypothetical protein
MDRKSFWQNFKLGEEVHIAGRFIFNGLRTFHEMDHLDNYDQVFETLYNLAVGLERLLKVAIVLTDDEALDQVALEKSLITHDHQSLLARLRKTSPLNFSTVHNDFIALLSTFYNSHRYDRYGLTSMSVESKEKLALHAFFEKHLPVKLRDNPPFDVSLNTDQMRKFLGRTVGKLVNTIYELIFQAASDKQIYTYEIRSDSKAAKIFLAQRFDFIDEDILWKELLVFFMNTPEQRGMIRFLKETEPLAFDPGLAGEYLDAFASNEKMLAVMGELESLYEEVDDKSSRLERIGVIGDTGVIFNDEDEESDEMDSINEVSDED